MKGERRRRRFNYDRNNFITTSVLILLVFLPLWFLYFFLNDNIIRTQLVFYVRRAGIKISKAKAHCYVCGQEWDKLSGYDSAEPKYNYLSQFFKTKFYIIIIFIDSNMRSLQNNHRLFSCWISERVESIKSSQKVSKISGFKNKNK